MASIYCVKACDNCKVSFLAHIAQKICNECKKKFISAPQSKHCKTCGKIFITVRKQKIYCSRKCRPKSKGLTHKRLKAIATVVNGNLIFKSSISVKRKMYASGRVKLTIDNNSYYEDRLIWFFHYGRWPKTKVDHINLELSNSDILNLETYDGKRQPKS